MNIGEIIDRIFPPRWNSWLSLNKGMTFNDRNQWWYIWDSEQQKYIRCHKGNKAGSSKGRARVLREALDNDELNLEGEPDLTTHAHRLKWQEMRTGEEKENMFASITCGKCGVNFPRPNLYDKMEDNEPICFACRPNGTNDAINYLRQTAEHSSIGAYTLRSSTYGNVQVLTIIIESYAGRIKKEKEGE
jgi:hypothetical protein